MKTKNVIVILALIVAILLLVVILKAKMPGNKNNNIEVHNNRAAVVKEMRELSRLETATFTIEKVIDAGTKGGKLRNFLFGEKILLIAHGNVIAGFDLSKIEEKDIVIQDKNITLRLPAPQIFISSIDNAQTRVYDRTRGILALGEKDLESEARQVAETSIRQAACDAGILEQAAGNGRRQLSAFFGTLGFSQITLKIPAAKC